MYKIRKEIETVLTLGAVICDGLFNIGKILVTGKYNKPSDYDSSITSSKSMEDAHRKIDNMWKPAEEKLIMKERLKNLKKTGVWKPNK